MKYFKNTELAKIYHISEKSVRNWIKAAESGEYDLALHEHNGKKYIANTAKNIHFIEQQVAKGKKFKNTRGLKTIVPSKEFYEIYDTKQIADIVSSVVVHKEIPLQYGYLNGGATSFDHYANRLVNEEGSNILVETIDLLDLQADYIDRLIGDRKVNVVDLGPGNGLPIRPTLARLLKQGRLNRYIALDISKDILTILEKNIKKWFNGEVAMDSYVRNFGTGDLDDLLVEGHVNSEPNTVNLVFLLGGTLSNFRLPGYILQGINNSLGANDLLICSGYLDTPYTRRYFDLSGTLPSQGSTSNNKPGVRLVVPALLNLNDALCDFEAVFMEDERSRVQWMIPKMDLVLNIKLGSKDYNLELNKEERILLWRHRHYAIEGVVQLFDNSNFDVLQATKSSNQNYFLTISKVRPGAAA